MNWISCEDSMPRTGEKVVAKYDGVYSDRLVTFWEDYNLNPHFGRIDEDDGKGSQPATHWSLISSPYT